LHDEQQAARSQPGGDGGIELVAPIEGRGSRIESWIDEYGEGFAGVVFAVADADESRRGAVLIGEFDTPTTAEIRGGEQQFS